MATIPVTYTCQYCKELCSLEHAVVDGSARSFLQEEVWRCKRHPVLVRHVVFPDISYICLSVLLGDKRYSVSIHPENVCIVSQVFIGRSPFSSFSTYEICRFPFNGEITPDNVQQKLPIILTFL
jgi:hypothetical protein